MKKLSLLAVTVSAVLATPAVFAAGSSYVTGNVQFNSKDFTPSNVMSTLEAGHTFETGTTLLVEFDGISLDETNSPATGVAPIGITLGLEQSFNLSDNLWVAAGYHHVLVDGEAVSYRPLVKIGYNFDNGISISNRTRYQMDATDGNALGQKTDKIRFDNKIAYSFSDAPVALAYNNVYYAIGSDDTNKAEGSMEHELRATWTREGVQPYVEYRNQDWNKDQGNNQVLVVGASYGF